MSEADKSLFSRIPSTDHLLNTPVLSDAIAAYGRTVVVEAAREVPDEVREALVKDGEAAAARTDESAIGAAITARVRTRFAPSLKPVFNLTGTVLHTNLGRAPMAPEAIEAAARIAAGASNLEFDLDTGRRGDQSDPSALFRLPGSRCRDRPSGPQDCHRHRRSRAPDVSRHPSRRRYRSAPDHCIWPARRTAFGD